MEWCVQYGTYFFYLITQEGKVLKLKYDNINLVLMKPYARICLVKIISLSFTNKYV